ncbi:hypothetical protein RXV86_17100 [Alisedimentitalea sp. MJ-SS2]|uniref:DUF5681 domain-containing protein n=1 Tax=Aliisedimentitalea sp. MJ-SS2 TaxID=3049795 RepID=UPI002909D226|nr:DUF5681 domain-containing protein [Alisedimentitalea sp. MJ-SS2]MDU8929113.1 hypothetical protein [Alisedimentitalea sp. MJ-SS2]
MANSYTDESGKFAPGNPGKPRGARHAATKAVADLLQGEAEGLTRKAIDMALEGDTVALRLCLERVAPRRKDTPVQFDLPPMECAQDAAQAAQAILQAVSDGGLTPVEASTVMSLIEQYRRTLELTEFETRIQALEMGR